MALNVYVEKFIKRSNQAGVNYLIEDDQSGEIRFNAKTVLRGAAMDDPAAYGVANAVALYADGAVVADGAVRIEKVRDKTTDDLREEALRLIRKGVRDGDTLAEILAAANALYADETGIMNFLTAAVQMYNSGTAAQQRQFNILMFYLLFARG